MAGLAGTALAAAIGEALAILPLAGGVHQGAAIGAAFPNAAIEIGPESEWGAKDRMGRNVRIAVTLADKGADPARLTGLMEEAETAVLAIAAVTGWELVTLRFVRSRIVRNSGGWSGVSEFRARMLVEE